MDSDSLVPPAPEPQPGPAKQPQELSGGEGSPAAPGTHPGGRNGRRNRRRRNRRNGKPHHQERQPRQQGASQPQNLLGNAGASVFTAPMDHSYRQQPQNEINGNLIGGSNGRNQKKRFGRGGFRPEYGNRPGMPPAALGSPHIEPVPFHENASTRVFAFVEDLFFVTKLNETARKLNVKLEFVKSVDELLEKTQGGEEKPSLIVVDLNSANLRPLAIIPKLKAAFKKGTSVLGFVSHLQGDLKLKAQEAGCDTVMPRSAFSQNLPQILRRHGAPEGME